MLFGNILAMLGSHFQKFYVLAKAKKHSGITLLCYHQKSSIGSFKTLLKTVTSLGNLTLTLNDLMAIPMLS